MLCFVALAFLSVFESLIWVHLTWVPPLQYSCLENPMDGAAWKAAVHGVAKSRTRLNNFTFTFHFHALEKEMATHSSVLAWRIPGTGKPGGRPSMGSHRVGHDWSNLAAATKLESKARPLVSHTRWPWILSTQSLLTYQFSFYYSFCFLPLKTLLSHIQGRIKKIFCLRSNKDNTKNIRLD